MASSSTNVPQVSFQQAAAASAVNGNFDMLSPGMFGGRDWVTTTGLTWGVTRGPFISAGAISELADTTVVLTGNATNYVEADAAGAITANTTSFTAGRLPLYTVVTNSSNVVTSYTDQRAPVVAPWIAQRVAYSFSSDANKTLTAAEARGNVIDCTSAVSLSTTRNLVVPLNLAPTVVKNGTTGGQSIQVIGASGTGVTIATGKVAIVFGDGTNIVRVTADQ